MMRLENCCLEIGVQGGGRGRAPVTLVGSLQLVVSE